MKFEWEYEGKMYSITGTRNGFLYLNGYKSDLCKWILMNFNIIRPYCSQNVKERAKIETDFLESSCKFKCPIIEYDPDITISIIGNELKAKWCFEDQTWCINGNINDRCFYLNDHRIDGLESILKNLKSTDIGLANRAKINAKEKYENAIGNIKNTQPQIETASLSKFSENVLFVFVFILALGVIGGVLYLIFQLWWIFVGDWAFDGPWADDVSAGEVAFDTIIFFIAFIVVIEEVIRRCINGHF